MTIFNHYALDTKLEVEVFEEDGNEFAVIAGKERKLIMYQGKKFAENSSWHVFE